MLKVFEKRVQTQSFWCQVSLLQRNLLVCKQNKSNLRGTSLRKLLIRSVPSINIFVHSGRVVAYHLLSTWMSDDVARANLFNDFFQSVYIRSLFNIPATDNSLRSETLSSVEIINTEVYEALVSLDYTKAMGLDGYCPALLKSCVIALYEPLTHLFNLSVTSINLVFCRSTPLFNSCCCFVIVY